MERIFLKWATVKRYFQVNRDGGILTDKGLKLQVGEKMKLIHFPVKINGESECQLGS
jgi:hypothetical protein